MRPARTLAIPLTALLIAAGCTDSDNDEPTSSVQTEQSSPEPADDTGSAAEAQSALDQAVDAIGGAESLQNLNTLRIEASGSHRIDYEAEVPTELFDASTYSSTYHFDLAADALQMDATRTLLFEAFQFFPEETYGVVINGDVGGFTTQTGFFPPGPMPSQYVGALRQQQRLFNPHFLLREALADPALVGDGGSEDYDGRRHKVVTLADAGQELRLFVDAETGLISKLETMENNPLVRDVPIEIRYSEWQEYGELSFPNDVELHTVGGLLHDEVRSAVVLEPTDLPDSAFVLPEEAQDSPVDTDALDFGRQSHHVVQAFFAIVFGYELGGATEVAELSPGVTLFGAGANSMAIDVDGGLVVLEAPLTPAHGSHIIEVLAEESPGVPITHLIQSHHHQDHAAGIRSFAAEGSTVVVGPGVRSHYDNVFAAPSTIRPDALSQTAIDPTIEEVPADGTFVIADDEITVTVHHLGENGHADDMVMTVVDTADARFVYQADLYNAGAGFTAIIGGPEALFSALRDLGIVNQACESDVPLTIVPSHGVAQSLEDSLAELEGQGEETGCA